MKSWTIRILSALLLVLTLVVYFGGQRAVPDASADSLKRGGVSLERVFSNIKLRNPVWMQQSPGSTRWYAVEQQGRLVTFPNDPSTKNQQFALDISDRVKAGGEMGLLGLAFHPKFADNGYIYLNYTSTEGRRHTRISRFERRADGITFDPSSEKILLEIDQPYSNHNGGQVSFGPDGFLYIGVGDGGLAGDPKEHSQNKDTLLGTMLRIDVDAKTPYGIPADNPYAAGGGAPEIFAIGLRNPWRFSFDRKTGKLWAGDVGQNAYEEISIIRRGGNYGWNIMEGSHCYDPPLHLKALGSGDCGQKIKLDPPVVDYSQDEGDRSVTGGYVYRGSRQKKIRGHYVYGDYVSGRIWAYDIANKKNRLLIDTGCLISSFTEASDGEIGVVDYTGKIYHLRVD